MTTAMMTTPAPLTMTSSTRDLDIVNAVRDSFVDVMGLDCHGDTRVEQCPMTGCIEIDYGRFVIGNIDAPVWQIIKQEYDLDDRTVVGPFTFNTTARADETDVATIVAAVVYTVVRHSLLA